MFAFRKLSIKYKIMLVVLATAGLGLVISMVGMMVHDRAQQREILAEEIRILAQVISARSAAALSFQDAVRAEENLSALLLRRSVVAACMYDTRQTLFAGATSRQQPDACERPPLPQGQQFTDHYLKVSEPVYLNQNSIGSLLVITDFSELNQRLANQLLVNAGILVVALFGAFLLTARFQRRIYEPVVQLGAVAHQVTHDGNYAIRAYTTNEDELGEAVEAFNAMLSRIERDKERLVGMAYQDQLTGLPNRRKFIERLERLLDTPVHRERLAVIFVDLDHFKEVNDTLGHDVGDQFLQACASRMAANVPETAVAYRLAGDEFTVLQTDVRDISDVEATAQAILSGFAKEFVWEGGTLAISASLGVARSMPEDDVSTLLKKADIAVYRAKDAGRNNYQVFEGSLPLINSLPK